MRKRFLSLHRHPPSLEAKEALDAALVAAVFDQRVTLLFRDQGVRQLVGEDVSEEMAEAVRSSADYGIEAIYVCQDALNAADLAPDSLLVPVQVLSLPEQAELLARQDMVLCD